MACLRYSRNLFQLQTLLQKSSLTAAAGRKLSSTPSFLPQPEPPKFTEVTEVKDVDWKYVERLLPPQTVPEFAKKSEYPSGWRPPAENVQDLPFYVKRTKNHMLPVYFESEAVRGARKMTVIRHVEGDIWELEQQLRAHLEAETGKKMVSQVHEPAMFIKFKGDHVLRVREWLYNAGF